MTDAAAEIEALRTALARAEARADAVAAFGPPFGPVAGRPSLRVSRHQRGERLQTHPEKWSGVLQADPQAGVNALYDADRAPGPIRPALCRSHARRKFFELADIAANARRGRKAPPVSPIAFEALTRIGAVFVLERAINGLPAAARLAARTKDIAPPVDDLHTRMTAERARLSRHAPVAKAMDGMLTRRARVTTFLEDGRICLTKDAAGRSLRGVALGRTSWLFAGSERGGDRAAFMYTLIGTEKPNGIDPQAWLADALARIADTPMTRLDDLLPWNRAALHQPVKTA